VPPERRAGVYDVESLTARLSRRCCPRCETQRRRVSFGEREPAVWYDTLLGDWVLRLSDGCGTVALLPLEIGWFDAPEVTVYRTASDIAHSGDVLEG
jgi:hypothetical protein